MLRNLLPFAWFVWWFLLTRGLIGQYVYIVVNYHHFGAPVVEVALLLFAVLFTGLVGSVVVYRVSRKRKSGAKIREGFVYHLASFGKDGK